ncbi:MAG: TIM barrel protein [Spirochaetales bacterium]
MSVAFSLALNRIACPRMPLKEFLPFSASVGIKKVELRNDLPGTSITDNLSAREVITLCEKWGVSIITINAVQHFNLKSRKDPVREELKRLLDLCVEIRCSALVFCPHNDASDTRSTEQIRAETIEALAEFGELLEKSKILGLVEPLGFRISSLSSAVEALKMIQASGRSCYKILLDTFHHYLGPDSLKDLGSGVPVSEIGLVHVSGVEIDLPKEKLTDEHRIFPSTHDRMKSKQQLTHLVSKGYAGDVSFEPFSSEVQGLSPDALKKALEESMQYLAEKE